MSELEKDVHAAIEAELVRLGGKVVAAAVRETRQGLDEAQELIKGVVERGTPPC